MDDWAAKLRRIALAYTWAILIWVGFSPVLAGQDKVRLLGAGLNTSYWTLLLVNGAWLLTAALLTPPVFYIVHRYPVVKQNIFWRLSGYLLGSVPYVVTSVFIRWIVLPPWNSAGQTFAPRSAQGLITNAYQFGNQIWDYAVILVAAHAYEYFRRAQQQELERAELRQTLATSELQVLKSQIHPHFLFNTLHSISALIDSDGPKAKAMIVMVSNLLRTALRRSQADLIPLHEELSFVEDYLAIEKIRLGDRLEVRWEVEPAARSLLVPQLILQPLFENAIVHGIACCREGGWIQITAAAKDRTLEIQIQNSMCGVPRRGMGVGLQNIRSRLKHLYGEEVRFEFTIHENQLATATLRLPAFESSQVPAALPEPEDANEVEGRHARSDRG